MCLAAKGRLQGRADKLMLCSIAINLLKSVDKTKFPQFITVSARVAMHIT